MAPLIEERMLLVLNMAIFYVMQAAVGVNGRRFPVPIVVRRVIGNMWRRTKECAAYYVAPHL
jgi:hypothetical protein